MAVRALVAGACVLATAIASPGIAAANPGSSDGPTIPYAPPAEDHGCVRNPTVPSMVWVPIEGAAGRIIGADLGAAALDELACTPITAIHVPYPADVALSASYVGSSARGMGILDGLVSAVDATCPDTTFVFAGYSQGADIVDGWAGDVIAGEAVIGPERIAAIAVFGNPRRGTAVAETFGTAPSDSLGILGPRGTTWGPLSDRVFDACNAGDIWCESGPGMRRIAPAVMAASLNPADARATAEALRTALGADIAGDPELREALDDVLRFLLDGSADHLTYEDDLEGLGSAREAALAFLLEHLAG
ncbi:cutinase family protein [Corynebacterium xerosis]|uniref:cutinase family protein n=1 Tax=Corynebacterium xerosis TaxID=1725 RepID=UPI003670548A